jgi:hypothetical protein
MVIIMARATKQETAQVEAFNPVNLSVEDLLALLAEKSNGKSLQEIEQEAQENKIRAIKTAFYDAVNVPNVISALNQFKQITLTIEGDVIVAEYGKAVDVQVIPEKGARVFKSHLKINNEKGELQYEIKGNYDKQFIEVLKNNIIELNGKNESYIRDYFKDHKNEVCRKLNGIDPVKYVIPA